MPRPPTSTPVPYATLFRSAREGRLAQPPLGLWPALTVMSVAGIILFQSLVYLSLRFTTSTNAARSEEHTSELQSRQYIVCRLLLVKISLALIRCVQHQARL